MTQWNKYSSKVWQDIANGEDLDSLAVDVDPDDYYDYYAPTSSSFNYLIKLKDDKDFCEKLDSCE